MILPAINIDISQIIDKSLFSVNVLNYISQSIVTTATYEIYHKIQELARINLKSTRNQYLSNLNVSINTNENTGFITLTDKLALMIEDGAEPFDMKEGFSHSNKRTIYTNKNKSGWYLTIPFRIGTPNVTGDYFEKMPNEIYNLAKKLKPYLLSTVTNDNLTNLPATIITKNNDNLNIDKLKQLDNKLKTTHSTPQSRAGIKNTKWVLPYEHKSPLYAGLVKISKQYPKATQNYYMTFRRVSSNSDENSWIHKGIKANKFFEKAMNDTDIDSLTTQIIADIFKELDF